MPTNAFRQALRSDVDGIYTYGDMEEYNFVSDEESWDDANDDDNDDEAFISLNPKYPTGMYPI